MLPQFIHPDRGGTLQQGLTLGAVQIAISTAVNALIILLAGKVTSTLNAPPSWQRVQRWLTGPMLGALAVRIAAEGRR